ncbi:MAG: hypothetical protein ACR2P1_09180 [Pseudomonadales bacterium]
MKDSKKEFLATEDNAVKALNANRFAIRDLSFANDIDSEIQKSIRGGRINLDDEAGEKKEPVVTGSAGGHPLETRFGAYWGLRFI